MKKVNLVNFRWIFSYFVGKNVNISDGVSVISFSYIFFSFFTLRKNELKGFKKFFSQFLLYNKISI